MGAAGGEVSFTVTDGASGVDSWTAQYRIGTGAWQDLGGTGTTRTIPSAPDGSVLGFRVRAVDNAGNVREYPSTPDATTRIDLTGPQAPTALAVEVRAGGDFRVTWSAPGNVAGAPVAAYVLEILGQGAPPPVTVTGPPYAAALSAPDGALYGFRVAAVDTVGNQGPFTDAVQSVAHNRAPEGDFRVSSPTHVVAEARPGDAVRFQWDALTSVPGDTIAYRYAFSRDAVHVVTTSDTASLDRTARFTDVEAGLWFFHVAAFGAGGSVQASPFPVLVSAPEPAPGITQEAISAANNGMTVQVESGEDGPIVSWTLPSDPPGDIEGVQVWRIQEDGTLVLVATLDKDSPEFQARSFTDPEGGDGYAVTAYYEGGVGRYSESEPPAPGTYKVGLSDAATEETGPQQEGRAVWPWVVGGIVLLVALLGGGAVLTMFLLRRRGVA